MKIPSLDLRNTPGVYYALTYGISALLFVFLNRRRNNRKVRMAAFAGLWAFLFAFMLVTYRIRVELFLVCVLIEILTVFSMIACCCEMSVTNLIYFTVRAFFIGELAASLEWQLFYYGLTSLGFPLKMWINLSFLLVIHSVFFFIIWHLEKPFREGNYMLTPEVPLRFRCRLWHTDPRTGPQDGCQENIRPKPEPFLYIYITSSS